MEALRDAESPGVSRASFSVVALTARLWASSISSQRFSFVRLRTRLFEHGR